MNEQVLYYLKNLYDRFLAFIIDYLFVLVGVYLFNEMVEGIFLSFLSTADAEIVSLVVAAITVPIAYFMVFEGSKGTTIGKKLYNLMVTDDNVDWEDEEYVKFSYIRAMIRNVSKVRLELVIIDLLFGYTLSRNKNQRFLEQISKTRVISYDPKYTTSEKKTQRAYRLILTVIALIFIGIWIYGLIVGYYELMFGQYT